MAKNIGLDFGTTYSVVSELAMNPETGDFTPRSVSLFTESKKKDNYYDTVAVRTDDGLECADAAHNKIGRGRYVTYTGFKLLLAEDENSELLQKHRYERPYLPADVVREYLNYLLQAYRNKTGDNIGKLVIGVPDVWMYEKTNGCYGILLDLVENMHIAEDENMRIAEEIEFLSEPEAACAYWVENYQKSTGKSYEGELLLIDYGGGTLDITLCNIKMQNGKPVIEISSEKRSGAGANTDREIGQAGLAFMEKVIILALQKSGISDEKIGQWKERGIISRGVFELEEKFKRFSGRDEDDSVRRFKRVFRAIDKAKLNRIINRDNPEDIFEKELWITDDVCCSITYSIIAEAYRDVIYDVLKENLEKVKPFIKDFSFRSEGCKVQMVGGFCNFYLVEEEIRSVLGITTDENDDMRFEGAIPRGDERTCAVAYGAALKANDQVEFLRQWEYSLGIRANAGEFLWAAKRGDELTEDQIYLIKRENSSKSSHLRGSGIDTLYFAGILDNPENPPSISIGKRIRLDSSAVVGYVMGVSMNRYKQITVWWWKLRDDIDPANIDRRLQEFKADINAGKEIPEFDYGRSGSIKMGKLLDHTGVIGG